MYSEGILLKAKIYIVLAQNFRNNKRERSEQFMSRKDVFANWSELGLENI